MKSIKTKIAWSVSLVLLWVVACSSGSNESNSTNQPAGTPPPAAAIAAAFPNLEFTQPVALLQSPLEQQRWYVVERAGAVRTFAGTNTTATTIFIDITDRVASQGEGGLLGMAFAPDFGATGALYLSYTGPGTPLTSHISRFTSLDDGLSADPLTEENILSVDQPFTNHNGGWIAFGPGDGFLYIGFGDGGSTGDLAGNGQNTQTLLGAILRLDVDHTEAGKPYAIPIDNPFFNSTGCESSGDCREIFAWGFRNPWRGSFDAPTGDLWIGDVGQNAWEEIDLVLAGGNYGWNILEGNHCYNAATCVSTGLIPPETEYDHSTGSSVTGGYIYRGTEIPEFFGDYIYGDFISGRIWRLIDAIHGGRQSEPIVDTGLNISAFAQDNNGEIYIISYSDGQIFRLGLASGP
jgi:glucose/arabinose dehydrogenase